MKVILKQDIKGVGRKFEVKEVSEGYANNFLFPKKLAEFASKDAVKKAEISKVAYQAEMEIKENLTKAQIESLKNVRVSISKKANEKGHLFEQVHKSEVAEALKNQASINIDSEYIDLETPIKQSGEHSVSVQVGKNRGEFVLVVEASN